MSQTAAPTLLARIVSSSILVFLGIVVVFGLSTGGHLKHGDDSAVYLTLADAARDDVGGFLTSHVTNLAFPAMLALLRGMTGHWEGIVLILNLLCAAVSGVLLVKTVQEVSDSAAAAVVALLFYVSCYDLFTWVGWLVTDSIFTTAALGVFLWSIRGVMDKRFFRFFQITSAGSSSPRNAYAIVYYLPLYGLALIGVLDGLIGVDVRRRAVVHVSLLWIASSAALSAVTFLDANVRSRLPVMPQLILLAACGVEAVVRKVTVTRPRHQFAR